VPVHCSTVNILPVHVLVFSRHTRDISATKGRGAGSAANYSNRPRNYTAPSVNRLVAERTDAAWSGPGIRKPRSAETTILPACRRRGGDCSNSRCLPAATHTRRARGCHRPRSTARQYVLHDRPTHCARSVIQSRSISSLRDRS